MNTFGISGMELSFTSIRTGIDKEQLEVQRFALSDYKRYKEIDGFTYLIARSNITISFNKYDEKISIMKNIELGLSYLYDSGIIKKYYYQQGICSLIHYMIADIPTREPEMDIAGCREMEGEPRKVMEGIFESKSTRFSVVHKFKVGNSRKLITHTSPTAYISKPLATLHKKNILSKASNLEIKSIFSLNNSSSKGNKKFIKNNMHFALISDIISKSLDNLLDSSND